MSRGTFHRRDAGGLVGLPDSVAGDFRGSHWMSHMYQSVARFRKRRSMSVRSTVAGRCSMGNVLNLQWCYSIFGYHKCQKRSCYFFEWDSFQSSIEHHLSCLRILDGTFLMKNGLQFKLFSVFVAFSNHSWPFNEKHQTRQRNTKKHSNHAPGAGTLQIGHGSAPCNTATCRGKGEGALTPMVISKDCHSVPTLPANQECLSQSRQLGATPSPYGDKE